jgi:glycosyltransferase involved in cell wall biosynthesis
MRSRKSEPLVSIGLPTHNGERHLREALDSLINQDYRNLEIVISDNASTDETFAIASGYAARDSRVRVSRHETNVGPAANFNFVLGQAHGEFFMWAADDDQWAPSYVSACVGALQNAPQAVLACTQVRFVDEAGLHKEMSPDLHDNPDLSTSSIRKRIRLLLSRETWYLVYGVIRRDVLLQTRRAANSYGADVVLTGELAIRGPFVKVPEPLFTYRKLASAEPDRGSWHNAIANREQVMATPYSFLLESFVEAIGASQVPLSAKLKAWGGLLDAAVFRPTPLRAWLFHEAGPRLALAREQRDRRAIAVFWLVGAAKYVYERQRRVRKTVAGAIGR